MAIHSGGMVVPTRGLTQVALAVRDPQRSLQFYAAAPPAASVARMRVTRARAAG